MMAELMMHNEPRPVATEWSSVGEMIRDVFTDLREDGVRDFLIHGPPLMDVHYLTTPACVENGLSTTASGTIVTDPGCIGQTPGELAVSLVIPTQRTEDFVFGIGVASHVPSELMKRFTASTDQSFRFAINLRTKRSIVVMLDHEHKLASVTLSINRNGEKTGCTLQFELSVFQEAFKYGINENCLQRVMKAFHYSRIDTSAAFPRLLPNDTGSILNGDKSTLDFKQIYQELVGHDNVFSWCISCSYKDGHCSYGSPFYMYSTHNFGTYPGIVNSLTSWATTCTLSRLKLVLQNPISKSNSAIMQSSEDNPAHNVPLQTSDSEHRQEKNTRQLKPALQIAPACSASNHPRKMTYAEEIDAIRDQKKEQRRRNNRIAAAKSNAKRRLQRLERLSS